jgi:formate-dependent nitrite reductase membrane component NrfD
VSAGKLRKLWDSLSEPRSSVFEIGEEGTILSPALMPVKTAQFTQLFRQVWHHTVKSLSLTESVQGALDMLIILLSIPLCFSPQEITIRKQA